MDPDGTPTELDARLLHGLAALDRGDFYEAHEFLEELWAGEVGAARHALQALIQVAVALHHHGNGNHAGARMLLVRAREHCGAITGAANGRVVGVDVAALHEWCEAAVAALDGGRPDGVPPLPPYGALCAEIRAGRQCRGLAPDPPEPRLPE